jgi:Methyl-accepting chemotaxis protein
LEEQRISNLEKWQYVLPIIQNLLPGDIAIGLTDRQKYLQYLRGKEFDLKIEIGAPIKTGSSVQRAMNERRQIDVKVDNEVYGQSYIASAAPIYDDNDEVIGAVAISTSVEIQDQIMQMSSKLSDAINVIAGSTQEISSQSQDVSRACTFLEQLAQGSNDRVKKTNHILDVIRDLSLQTKLLGFNAAIEAARAGASGLGFGVVADEISKLAEGSEQSIKQIAEIIAGIQADSEHNRKELNNVGAMVIQIAEAVSNIADTMQTTSMLASKLDHISSLMAK